MGCNNHNYRSNSAKGILYRRSRAIAYRIGQSKVHKRINIYIYKQSIIEVYKERRSIYIERWYNNTDPLLHYKLPKCNIASAMSLVSKGCHSQNLWLRYTVADLMILLYRAYCYVASAVITMNKEWSPLNCCDLRSLIVIIASGIRSRSHIMLSGPFAIADCDKAADLTGI